MNTLFREQNFALPDITHLGHLQPPTASIQLFQMAVLIEETLLRNKNA